ELENRLNQFHETEARLELDASHRIQDIGRLIEHEWEALRQIHEEPVKQLREQAASLTEVCLATASTAQSGFDRAETRLAALESEFHRRMSDLSREVQSAMAEIRARAALQPWTLPEATPQAWPLEGVMRLHNQLRQPEDLANAEAPAPQVGLLSDGASVSTAALVPAISRPAPEATVVLTERIDSLER